MGRIDDALRRSNLDVGRDAGAATPAPDSSPWGFEPNEAAPAPSPDATKTAPAPESAAAPEPAPRAEEPEARPREGRPGVAPERLVTSKMAPGLLIEQFRGLAATLLAAKGEHPLKSVIVTSASPGDGKSHVAVNLALTLSDSYKRRVLLIDADLRRPTLHQIFGEGNSRGLSDALEAAADEKVATVQVSETLTLLPAGRPDSSPLGGLSSDRMKQIIADAQTRFDWVVVDSPPVGLLADARIVSDMVDGVLLVVRAGATRFQDMEAAADVLGHERILGVVLNAMDPVDIRGEGYYRSYYSYSQRQG